ncbi:MAG: hypothetical protein WA001_01890 [Patescibacteria group bacterium]
MHRNNDYRHHSCDGDDLCPSCEVQHLRSATTAQQARIGQLTDESVVHRHKIEQLEADNARLGRRQQIFLASILGVGAGALSLAVLAVHPTSAAGDEDALADNSCSCCEADDASPSELVEDQLEGTPLAHTTNLATCEGHALPLRTPREPGFCFGQTSTQPSPLGFHVHTFRRSFDELYCQSPGGFGGASGMSCVWVHIEPALHTN